jgi:hypothetical protein
MIHKKIFISGAITGVEKEAEVYFAEAERLIAERFPGAQIFNPIKLPKMATHEDYMIVCRSRIKGWADTLVSIMNDPYKNSVGAKEEHELAQERGLSLFDIDNGKPNW